METMTLAEFNAIPDFIHNGVLYIDIDGKIYSKNGVFKMLVIMGIIIVE